MVKHITLRLPRDVKKFIETEAQKNTSSQNSEIVRAIRVSMKAKSSVEAATSPSDGSTNPVEGKANEQTVL